MRYMAIVRRPEGPDGLWSVENIDAQELTRVQTLGCIPVNEDCIPDTRGFRWMASTQNRLEEAIKRKRQYDKEHPFVKRILRWVGYWIYEVVRPR
jgi:hypothetical protein